MKLTPNIIAKIAYALPLKRKNAVSFVQPSSCLSSGDWFCG